MGDPRVAVGGADVGVAGPTVGRGVGEAAGVVPGGTVGVAVGSTAGLVGASLLPGVLVGCATMTVAMGVPGAGMVVGVPLGGTTVLGVISAVGVGVGRRPRPRGSPSPPSESIKANPPTSPRITRPASPISAH